MSEYKQHIITEALPQHIAIIMDGNGRWAKQHSRERVFGHRQGVDAVRKVTEAAAQLGIKYLTLYTFSSENWNRPKSEVDALMSLLVDTIEAQTPVLQKNNVRLLTIGDIDRLPAVTRERFVRCLKDTGNNTGLRLVIALSYSARWEIVEAAKKLAKRVNAGQIKAEDINEEMFAQELTTSSIPEPDLLIRTSGELRISNFLLWQIAYTELYFTPTLWPDFDEEELYKAIVDYQQRERRFGKTSEQLQN